MKNILIIVGGGRANGNTAQLVTAFTKGVEEAGHKVERVSLHCIRIPIILWTLSSSLKAFIERFYCIAEEI